ncbi:MAG: DUF4351 domain-containing protein, partial [Coleofasciculus sp. S288]|nr:DUF4351 domain-containing protein [Coleofasciculus sp. S288]
IASCAEIFAGLRFEKDLIRQLFREEIMQGSVIYQDILQQGKRLGLREGQREGEIKLILRLLTRRLGELNPTLIEQIQALPTFALEELGEALLDFSQVTDLVAWLEPHQRREGEVAVIIRQLTRRLGEIEPSQIERVRELSSEQLAALAEALLDFTQVTDLITWLEQQEE